MTQEFLVLAPLLYMSCCTTPAIPTPLYMLQKMLEDN